MDFELSEDQRELQRTVRDFLHRHATSTIVREAAERQAGFAAAAWQRIVAEMELTSLAIDAAHGGAGAGFVEVGIALEELGRTLLPVPYLPTVVAAAAITAAVAEGTEATAGLAPLLQRIAAGAIATVALRPGEATATGGQAPTISGVLEHVPDGARAELLIVAAADRLFAVDLSDPEVEGAKRVERIDHPTLDQTRRQATLRCDAVPAIPVGATNPGHARDLLMVAHAVESVGAAARCLELTVAYLGERVQFGRPIGSFQALKHRCADLLVALEAARSTAYYAVWAVDGAPSELPVLAPLAQLVCGEAFGRIAAEAIQLHGGIGFTWEHDAHLYFKRAKATELLAGGDRALRRLVGERAGIL